MPEALFCKNCFFFFFSEKYLYLKNTLHVQFGNKFQLSVFQLKLYFLKVVQFNGIYHPYCARKITRIFSMRVVQYFSFALFKMSNVLKMLPVSHLKSITFKSTYNNSQGVMKIMKH